MQRKKVTRFVTRTCYVTIVYNAHAAGISLFVENTDVKTTALTIV